MKRRVFGMGSVQSSPRIMRGYPVVRPIMYDVPLMKRDLAGVEIEMPEECGRPGEVFLSTGVCGPDPRQPMDPYATPPVVVSAGTRITMTAPGAASAQSVVGSMSKTTMLLAAIGAVGLIYYLGKQK